MSNSMIAHNVYFSLHDSSPHARARLVAACKRYLTGHPGTVFYAAGIVCAELNRPVNDLDYDVGLHLVFKSMADHDAYQEAPRHHEFINENKASWKKVRVFDSVVEGD